MVFFWFRNGLLTVCSLTREERRKRNVGGIVCGDFEVYSFEISKKNMAARFLEKMLIPDLTLELDLGV